MDERRLHIPSVPDLQAGRCGLRKLTQALGGCQRDPEPEPASGTESRKPKAVLGTRRHAHPQPPGVPPGLVAVWGVHVGAEATF